MIQNYKSFGSFAPLYIEKVRTLQSLMKLSDWRVTYFTLHELAHHADPRGICYPGIKRIAEFISYAPSAIERAIGILHNHDYVRTHYQDNMLTGKRDRVYQLSPYVLWIDKDHIEAALNLWSVEKILTKVEEPTESNQLHKPTTRTSHKPATQQQQSEKSVTPSPDFEPQTEGIDTYAERETDYYQGPSTDQIIKQLVVLGTTEPAAKKIVTQYNSREILGTINYITEQIQGGAAINNPVGLLTHMLKNGTADAQFADSNGYYKRSKYADFINH